MGNNRDKDLADIENLIKGLPEKMQGAVYWTITHFDFVEEISKNSEMTDKKIEKYIEDTSAKEDYIKLALLCAVQIFKNNRNDIMK